MGTSSFWLCALERKARIDSAPSAPRRGHDANPRLRTSENLLHAKFVANQQRREGGGPPCGQLPSRPGPPTGVPATACIQDQPGGSPRSLIVPLDTASSPSAIAPPYTCRGVRCLETT